MGNLSVKNILYLILGLQLFLSILTVAVDVDYRLLKYFNRKEITTGPILPGDQKRVFEPRKSSPNIFPDDLKREVQIPEKMPPRLMFRLEESPKLGSFIFIHGTIEEGDFVRLEQYLESNVNYPKLVAFNSPGGSVYESLKIGRFLRSRDIETVMLPGMYCFSACPYMFGGGIERLVYDQSAIGMHQHYFDESIILPAFLAVKDIQYGQAITMEYLVDMGIEPTLLIFTLKTPPDEIYVLIEEELIETKLATKYID